MTSAMAARLAFAVAAAVGCGLWLVRVRRRAPQPPDAQNGVESPPGRLGAGLRTAVIAWCAIWAVIWLAIAIIRLRYPFELEWNGGAIRDHCERLLAGRPLYVAPGPDWFPYEYPPLYFWVSSLLMRLLHDGTFAPLRLVSVISTVGCAALLYAWVVSGVAGAAGKRWGFIAAGIFLASYRFTGAWYDVERLDMLFLALSLLGGWCLALSKGTNGSGKEASARSPGSTFGALILAAIAFWLAFLTKQQAVLFLFGGAAALAWSRRWRDLAVFGGLSALLCFGSVAALNRATDGWFGYYCFRVPLANGVKLHLAAQYFLTDLPLYAPLITLLALSSGSAGKRTGSPEEATGRALEVPGCQGLRPNPPEDEDALPSQSISPPELGAGGRAQRQNGLARLMRVFSMPAALSEPGWASAVAWCVMGLFGSLLSRAHWGGDQNVLLAGFIGLTLVGCMVAARTEKSAPAAAAPLYGLALVQLLTLVYRPDAQLPTASNRIAGERYQSAVRRLEREGEVLCLDHGGVTTPRHFQLMALLDVVGTEKRLPPGIESAVRSRRYAAILTDAKPEPGGAFAELYETYAPAECLEIETPWIVTGFPTPGPTRKVWVLRPR
jgi:hypothetical protein